ncbi:MAG: PAS domain-containing protein [Terracidiphilus sp.]
MSERPEGVSEQPQPAPAAPGGFSLLWLILPFSILAVSVGAALARQFPRFHWGIAAGGCSHLGNGAVCSAVEPAIAPRWVRCGCGADRRRTAATAGLGRPGVVALDLGGRLIYCNPAAERMLGYRATELAEQWETIELLAPGEAETSGGRDTETVPGCRAARNHAG